MSLLCYFFFIDILILRYLFKDVGGNVSPQLNFFNVCTAISVLGKYSGTVSRCLLYGFKFKIFIRLGWLPPKDAELGLHNFF